MNKLLFLLSSIIIFSFSSCNSVEKENSNTPLTDAEKEQYLEKGKEIASATFKALSGELKEKISAGGIVEAIDYCNVAAMPLTDELSNEYNVEIRRVSDKLRNPANSPDSIDTIILAEYGQLIKEGSAIKPVLTELDDQVRFSAPILVKPECLNCHGVPEKDIIASNYELIKSRYPNDQAIDYMAADLRGIWSITFLKE